ncbi:UDP-glucosyl transferase family protein (cytochrome P450) [Colletotrichum musicola]|uniref:UDP-glucosyl transferase family protein (Cytochrome P450) n=1 Tax=Colletotrichum musicola TaxID=2175873 RepID=A0A8H6KWH2_9PEZI|nr:UDP-glucosyl transferase family protein (cytochrome P450) [Colletotrichum musicola]
MPTRRVPALSTTGGFTHAAPVLDICRALADRGHTIEFATHDGQEVWLQNPNYTFVNKVHLMGPGPTPEQYDDHWRRMVQLRVEDALSSWLMWKSKYLWDSYWPATYHQLKELCLDPATRPDFIVADFFDETAARDTNLECAVPIAVVWPQMPYLLAPASYIPGQPGFQIEVCLTSERASLYSRLRNELAIIWAVPQFLSWKRWFTKLRRKEGAQYPVLPGGDHPHHLVLVNSFFGLEAPKDLPPLIAAVGPVLPDQYPALSGRYSHFLEAKRRVVYVSLGTNVVLPEHRLRELLQGLILALDGGCIDGVIWALKEKARKGLDLDLLIARANGRNYTLGELLDSKADDFLVPFFAPQRAILNHSHTKLFLTHGGGSSANEALYHGVPALVLGFMFDQLANGVRLEKAGCGLPLDKNCFTATDVARSVDVVVQSASRDLLRNVERMRRIATIAARGKDVAADLIEEVMFDHELRESSRPMHLQTADMRMSWWKAHNWDLVLTSLAGVIGLPIVTVCLGRLVLRYYQSR